MFDKFRSIFKKTAAPVSQPQNADSGTYYLDSPEDWGDFLHGFRNTSGQRVNESTAMQLSAVFACVGLVSGALASSPCVVYRRGEKRRDIAESHPLSPVLRLKPNPRTTAATFWRAMTSSKLLHGNAYALISRFGDGRPGALTWIHPRRVSVYYAHELGLDRKAESFGPMDLVYQITDEQGKMFMYAADDIIHVPGPGWDGKRGMSVLGAAADAFGVGLGAQEHTARFYKQGASFNFAISYPQKLGPEAAASLRDYWTKKHQGVGNHHIPPILTEGGELKPFSMSARDAQLLESRQFSVVDICRWFGTPPVMIGETEKTTSWGSGVEEMARWFRTFTLTPHLVAFEQEMEVKLFRRGGFFAEFDETELTRGDMKTRHEAYRSARGSLQEPGYMTINEIRDSEGYPPVEGGDELMRPVTTTTAQEA